jgi:hypothetical protein
VAVQLVSSISGLAWPAKNAACFVRCIIVVRIDVRCEMHVRSVPSPVGVLNPSGVSISCPLFEALPSAVGACRMMTARADCLLLLVTRVAGLAEILHLHQD